MEHTWLNRQPLVRGWCQLLSVLLLPALSQCGSAVCDCASTHSELGLSASWHHLQIDVVVPFMWFLSRACSWCWAAKVIASYPGLHICVGGEWRPGTHCSHMYQILTYNFQKWCHIVCQTLYTPIFATVQCVQQLLLEQSCGFHKF